MTTIEEMVETFLGDGQITSVRDGLLAVIEKHVGPMLEKAFVAGWNVTHSNGLGSDESSTKYAARVIAQLKGQKP